MNVHQTFRARPSTSMLAKSQLEVQLARGLAASSQCGCEVHSFRRYEIDMCRYLLDSFRGISFSRFGLCCECDERRATPQKIVSRTQTKRVRHLGSCFRHWQSQSLSSNVVVKACCIEDELMNQENSSAGHSTTRDTPRRTLHDLGSHGGYSGVVWEKFG